MSRIYLLDHKMPKEYILILVFDRNNESMIILINKKNYSGWGICYKRYPE